MTRTDDRPARLAAALRANLGRRKTQARAADAPLPRPDAPLPSLDAPAPGSGEPASSLDDEARSTPIQDDPAPDGC